MESYIALISKDVKNLEHDHLDDARQRYNTPFQASLKKVPRCVPVLDDRTPCRWRGLLT